MRHVPLLPTVLPTLLLSVPRHAPVSLVAEPPMRTPIPVDPYRPPESQFWEQPSDFSLPEELLGPWEVQCTLSGFGAMWVEFAEDGECKCASRVGKGRLWSATPMPGNSWRVRFVLLDKLSRPLRWEGTVQPDDVRGTVVSGNVRGPPKLGATQAEMMHGVVVGEFSGYKLQ